MVQGKVSLFRHGLLILCACLHCHRSLNTHLHARIKDIARIDPRILLYMLFHLDESSISLASVRYLIETRPRFALNEIPLLACAHAILFNRGYTKITDAKEIRSILRQERRKGRGVGAEGYGAIDTADPRGIYLELQAEAFNVDEEDLAGVDGLAFDIIDPQVARYNLFGLMSAIFGPGYDRCELIEKALMGSYPVFFPVHMMGPDLLIACLKQATASCVGFALMQPTFTIESFLFRPTLTIAWYLLWAYNIDSIIHRGQDSEALPEHFRGTASVIARELQDDFAFATVCEVYGDQGFEEMLVDTKVMGKWVRVAHGEQKGAIQEIVCSP
jgi:hypothetical protein